MPFQFRDWIPSSKELRALSFTGPAIVVYLAAVIILEYAGFGLMTTDPKQPFASGPFLTGSLTSPFSISTARVGWLSAVMVFSAAALTLVIHSIVTMRRFLSPRGYRGYMAIAALAGIVSTLALAAISRPSDALSLFFHFTDSALDHSPLVADASRNSARRLVEWVNLLASLVPGIAMLAACATVAHQDHASNNEELRSLRERMANLKALLSVGSGVLVAGALHTLMWLRWPIALISDTALKQAIGDWALSVTLYMGSAYSLMIVSLYVPCATSLIKQAEAALNRASQSDKEETDISAWLAKNGFSSSPIHQIPQIVAALAPMLAGPLGSAIVGFSGHAGQ